MKRNGEWAPKSLDLFAAELSKLPTDDVLAVLEQIGATPRRDGEPALPDYGTILLLVEDRFHPLRHLREIVRKMALNFGVRVTPEMLQNFEQFCGHRTDEDLDHALEQVMRSATITKMPTTGQFRDACGIMRVRRDGKQPQ